MTQERPKLTDTEEWKIVRQMYFEPKEKTEEKEREEIKAKQKTQSR